MSLIQSVPEAEAFAKKLAASATPLQAYKEITQWAKKNIVYDHIRAVKVVKNKDVYPDPERCWKMRMGICSDISALVVVMLRAINIKAKMVVGWANSNYHAWVEAEIHGLKYRFDHSAGIKKPKYIALKKY